MSRTALYRHFDAAGALLYVGISLSAMQRLAAHKTTSHWFGKIARVDIEWHASRAASLRAEAAAIAGEAPLFNIARPRVHAAPPTPAQREPRWDYAVRHLGSGYRDGNYFDQVDAAEMLDWWRSEFPREQFELVRTSGPARTALRPLESLEWRRSA